MLPNPSCAYSCGTTPSPCLNPTTPLHAAGIRVEPPPSVAIAIGTRPAATATAEPPLDPPELRSARQALHVHPNSGASVRQRRHGMCLILLRERDGCCRLVPRISVNFADILRM